MVLELGIDQKPSPAYNEDRKKNAFDGSKIINSLEF
jgi:hypothetical protein